MSARFTGAREETLYDPEIVDYETLQGLASGLHDDEPMRHRVTVHSQGPHQIKIRHFLSLLLALLVNAVHRRGDQPERRLKCTPSGAPSTMRTFWPRSTHSGHADPRRRRGAQRPDVSAGVCQPVFPTHRAAPCGLPPDPLQTRSGARGHGLRLRRRGEVADEPYGARQRQQRGRRCSSVRTHVRVGDLSRIWSDSRSRTMSIGLRAADHDQRAPLGLIEDLVNQLLGVQQQFFVPEFPQVVGAPVPVTIPALSSTA